MKLKSPTILFTYFKIVFILTSFLGTCFFAIHATNASTTSGAIDSTNKYAWSENVGWINFGTDDGNVTITDSAITGYAWNDIYGWIHLAPTMSGVVNNSEGDLSGQAWGEGLGWIDFDGITIGSDGIFTGYASGTVTGRISFNCENTDSCDSSDFKVSTDWRPASARSSGSSDDEDGNTTGSILIGLISPSTSGVGTTSFPQIKFPQNNATTTVTLPKIPPISLLMPSEVEKGEDDNTTNIQNSSSTPIKKETATSTHGQLDDPIQKTSTSTDTDIEKSLFEKIEMKIATILKSILSFLGFY